MSNRLSKATVGLEGVQTMLNEHTKELAKLAQKRITFDISSKAAQAGTLKAINDRVKAMELERQVLSDLTSTFESFCEDYNKEKQ